MTASSNDLLADRRFAWAKALADEGDVAAAADLLEQVVDRVPDWAPGWAALAEARESCGRPAEAILAWTRAAALDRGSSLGAELHLARLAGLTPDAMAEDYVRTLFDHYAPRFERHLVEDLAYRGPALLMAALDVIAPGRRFSRTLDLGCGTGLMGRALADRCERIDGVDLSPAMVKRARATGAYAELTAGSLDSALAGAPVGEYDLVVAADVFVYLGDLTPTLSGVARVLAPGGLLGFTAQTLCDGDGFALGPDMRFSHAPDSVASALRTAGLSVIRLDPAWARREKGIAVPGFVGLATRASAPDR